VWIATPASVFLEGAAAALPELCCSVPVVALGCERCKFGGVADNCCCHLALTRSREGDESWQGRAVSARVHVNALRAAARAYLRERKAPRAGPGGAEKQGSSRLQTADGILSVHSVRSPVARAHHRFSPGSGLTMPVPKRATGRRRAARAGK